MRNKVLEANALELTVDRRKNGSVYCSNREKSAFKSGPDGEAFPVRVQEFFLIRRWLSGRWSCSTVRSWARVGCGGV